MLDQALEAAYRSIIAAGRPEDVFGLLASENDMQSVYRHLMRVVHPDRWANDGDPRARHMSSEAASALSALYHEARRAFSAGSYGRPSGDGCDGVEFEADGRRYRIRNAIAGDVARILFVSRLETDGSWTEACIKSPLDPSDQDLVDTEHMVLERIAHKSMPVLLGRMDIDGTRANILRKVGGAFTMDAIAEKMGGIPEEHLVWMLARTLSVTGFLHISGVIHGAIAPQNILVTPHDHNCVLCDYVFAIPDADKPGARYRGANDCSPDGLGPDMTPHPRTDMQSIGKTFFACARTNLHPRLVEFLGECERGCISDAWGAWHRLVALRRELHGTHRFLDFKI